MYAYIAHAYVHVCIHACLYASTHTDVNLTARQRNPMPHAARALTCLRFILGRWSPFSTTHDAISSPFLPRVFFLFPFCPTFTDPSQPQSSCFPAHICVYMPASASAYPPPPRPNNHHTHARTHRDCMLAHDFPALPAHIPSDYAFKFKHKLPTPQGPLYVWHGTKSQESSIE